MIKQKDRESGRVDTVVSPRENAILLISEISTALCRGTKHYRKSDGKQLYTTREILLTLINEDGIIFEPAG